MYMPPVNCKHIQQQNDTIVCEVYIWLETYTGKCSFTSGLYKMWCTFILIYTLRLIRTTSLVVLLLLFPENISLLMQCVESVIDIHFPSISLISVAMAIRCFWTAMTF